MEYMNNLNNEHTIDAIIFDLVGVLFRVNSMFIFRSIGIRKLLLYVLRNGTHPLDDGLALLNKMRLEWPNQFQDLIPYKNTYLPRCVCLWQQGHISSQEATDEIKKFIVSLSSKNYFKNSNDKEFLLRLMSLFVDSKVGMEALKIIKPMEKLVENLKSNNYQLFILSNIDKETFTNLYQEHQSFFTNFNDIVTSYKTNLLKPEPSIFNYLLKNHQLRAHQCCFIDDQQENLIAAANLGIIPVKFDTYHKLIYQLQSLGFTL